jgi:hypothetical protein
VTLSIIWLGPGELSKVVLISYTTVFIVTLNTIAGVRAVDRAKLRAAASLGAGRRRRSSRSCCRRPSAHRHVLPVGDGQHVPDDLVGRHRRRAVRVRLAHLDLSQRRGAPDWSSSG